MDNKFRSFIKLSFLAITASLAVLAAFVYIYGHFTIKTYNELLLIAMLVLILITLSFIFSVVAVFYTYRKKHAGGIALVMARIGLRLVSLATVLASLVHGGSKDELRGFYIDANNILVQSEKRRYRPGQVLVLLPHCLQDSGCRHKITNDINNCERCGKCCIGEIAEMAENAGVSAAVVTGGTAARNHVGRMKPGLIISVACERDLASGISDVGKIPVIGIVNDRPNGPCFNTAVDVENLRQKLDLVLKSS